MDLPDLNDMVRVLIKSIKHSDGTTHEEHHHYVRVSDAEKLLQECRRLQHSERMCREKTALIADQSGEIERLKAEVERLKFFVADLSKQRSEYETQRAFNDQDLAQAQAIMSLGVMGLISVESVAIALASARLTERLAAQAEVKRLIERLECAWGVIANAGAGDWANETAAWQAAAARWRDECWHATLDESKHTPLSGVTSHGKRKPEIQTGSLGSPATAGPDS
jgi:hypothetical protein